MNLLFSIFVAGVIATTACSPLRASKIELDGANPPNSPIPATLYGMHVHRLAKSTPWPRVPIGAIRLHDAEYVSWATIEKKPGLWDFRAFDKNVEEALANQTQILYTFGQTPNWAALNKNAETAYGLPGSSSPPADLELWRRYVRTVVRRYKGRIAQYEIWNEASAPNFYSGSMQTLLDMSRIAYETVKEEDPKAIVLSPSGTGDDGMNWLNNFLFAGGGKYCDVVSYHFYHHGMSKEPERIDYMIESVRNSMKHAGIQKPVWDTESFNGPPAPNWSAEEAKILIPRAFLMHWYFGIERYYYYSWDNFRNGVQMLTPELEIANGGKAFAQIQNWTVGRVMRSCTRDEGGMWTASLVGQSGQKSWIVWCQSGQRVIKFEQAKTQQLILGTETPLSASKQITVGTTPVLLRP